MTIQQAYQTLGLDGSENLDTIEKQFIELYNDTRIRLSNEFDEWRRTELEKHIEEIKTARSVLHEIPAAVPVILSERDNVRIEKSPERHRPFVHTAKSSRYRRPRSIAIALAVIIHVLVFACVGWEQYRSMVNNRNDVPKAGQNTGKPAGKTDQKRYNAHPKPKRTPEPARNDPGRPLSIPEKRMNDIEEAKKLLREGNGR